ncbi:hypothetical protein [Tateyamaria sp. SN3-11]|uniref:hypothetical protein n=1 Tax=Tateyamaria sp. SN3-11 TaxID=3092147 RepID=UPI0039EA6289
MKIHVIAALSVFALSACNPETTSPSANATTPGTSSARIAGAIDAATAACLTALSPTGISDAALLRAGYVKSQSAWPEGIPFELSTDKPLVAFYTFQVPPSEIGTTVRRTNDGEGSAFLGLSLQDTGCILTAVNTGYAFRQLQTVQIQAIIRRGWVLRPMHLVAPMQKVTKPWRRCRAFHAEVIASVCG